MMLRRLDRPADRRLVWPLVLLGLGAFAVPLLGPLGFGVLRYHVSGGAVAQIRGGDVAGLLLVAPVSLLAAWLVAQRHPAAAPLAAAPASYAVYLYSQLAIPGDVRRYSGNSERFFALFWSLIVLGTVVLVLAAARIASAAVTGDGPTYPTRLLRIIGWYLLAVAAFLVVGLHLPGLLDALRDRPASAEYLADPVVFWVVKLMDLAFVVPLLVAVGVGAVRGRRWVRHVVAPLTGWCALLSCSVAGMGVALLVTGAAGASPVLAAGFVVLALAAVALAAATYRSLVRSTTHTSAEFR